MNKLNDILWTIVLITMMVVLLGVFALGFNDISTRSNKVSPVNYFNPAIVIQSMEAGSLYCPQGTQVFTESVYVGFRVYCK